MIVQDIFVCPLIVEKLSLDNDSIYEFCKKNYNNSYPKNRLDITDEVFVPLNNNLQNVIEVIHRELEFSEEYKFIIDDIWVSNENNNPSIHNPHIHWNCIFTAVYYVRASESSAKLKLLTPNSALPHIINSAEHISKHNRFNSEVWNISPETGDLVIFPSWIMHYVEPNSDLNRMSIAMNISLVKI